MHFKYILFHSNHNYGNGTSGRHCTSYGHFEIRTLKIGFEWRVEIHEDFPRGVTHTKLLCQHLKYQRFPTISFGAR